MAETPTGHVVALGGGGFSMRNGFTALDAFVLSLAGRPRPRVCFIPTASADSAFYIARVNHSFLDRRADR